jgi:outer membrane protein TolC
MAICLLRTQAVTVDQNHDYTAEQQAYDMGAMDLFPLYTGSAGPPPAGPPVTSTTGLTMGYYDSNTVTQYGTMLSIWKCQDTMPVRRARFTLQLPAGWEFRSFWRNRVRYRRRFRQADAQRRGRLLGRLDGDRLGCHTRRQNAAS